MTARRSTEQAQGPETPEETLKRMGFPSAEPLRYFPDMLSIVVPGLGQFFNNRYAPFQIVKTFLFAWFIWMALRRGLEGQFVDGLAVRDTGSLMIAGVLYAVSAADFLWTRRNYNRKLVAARVQLGLNDASKSTADPLRY